MDRISAYRESVVRSLHKLRLFEVGRIMRRNKITIVGYHRFASPAWRDGAIPAALFEAQLKYLKGHFTCISFHELSHVLAGRLHIKNPLILTVDDGHHDFIEVALPLLAKYEIPATLFVTTGFVDNEIWLWPDIVTYAVSRTEEKELSGFNSEHPLPLRTSREKRLAYESLQEVGKCLSEEDKREFLRELAERLRVRVPPSPSAEFRPVSWEDLKKPNGGLIDIGSHTLTHPILSNIPAEQAETEIRESKRRIEQELDREVIAFSYPNGTTKDYTKRNIDTVRNSGYSFAVTCEFGHNAFDCNPFRLNRIISQNDIAYFVREVSGFEDLWSRFRVPSALGRLRPGTGVS